MTRNISKTVTDTTLDPTEHLHVRPTGFQMAPSPLTFDDLEGSKIKVILFYVKYVKNGNSHGVGPICFTLDDFERLKVKVTNGAVTAIGMWGYTPVWLTGLLVCFSVFLSARIVVTDISGVSRRRAMKFCRMVDLGVARSCPLLVNFSPGLAPQGPKSEKTLVTHIS